MEKIGCESSCKSFHGTISCAQLGLGILLVLQLGGKGAQISAKLHEPGKRMETVLCLLRRRKERGKWSPNRNQGEKEREKAMEHYMSESSKIREQKCAGRSCQEREGVAVRWLSGLRKREDRGRKSRRKDGDRCSVSSILFLLLALSSSFPHQVPCFVDLS